MCATRQPGRVAACAAELKAATGTKTKAATPIRLTSRHNDLDMIPLTGTPSSDPSSLLGVQDGLAQPHHRRRYLDALVIGAELQRLLQAEQPGRDQPFEFLGGRLAHVGELALSCDVDIHVVGPRVLADDHALVHLSTRFDE